jgi:hypothetical protein
MRKILPLLTILLCCTFGILAQDQIQPEEYEVYKVLLGDGYQSVVSKFTVVDELNAILKTRKRELSVVQSETRKNYNQRNQRSFELHNNFGIKPSVKLVVSKDVSLFFEMARKNELAAEDAFYKKFASRTLIHLSRVGFNKNKNQALVSFTSNDGLCGTCSTNYIFVLSKQNSVWVIEKEVMG